METNNEISLTKVETDIIKERRRQVIEEGYTFDNDNELNANMELAQAAACYALTDGQNYFELWPYHKIWFKPKDKRSNLVRAAAMLIAQIELLDYESDDNENTEEEDNSLCEECMTYPKDSPSNLCVGCDEYKNHLA